MLNEKLQKWIIPQEKDWIDSPVTGTASWFSWSLILYAVNPPFPGLLLPPSFRCSFYRHPFAFLRNCLSFMMNLNMDECASKPSTFFSSNTMNLHFLAVSRHNSLSISINFQKLILDIPGLEPWNALQPTFWIVLGSQCSAYKCSVRGCNDFCFPTEGCCN